MAEAPQPTMPPLTVHEVPWLRLLPWLRLFHAPAAAANPKRLLIAGLGLALLQAGWSALGRLFPDTGWVTEWSPVALEASPTVARLLAPLLAVMSPFVALFSTRATGAAFAHAALAAAWALLVWGLAGGALARVAVVSLAKHERVGLREALGFSARKAKALVGTPAISLLGVLLVVTLLAGFGLLYRVPGPAGAALAGWLAFLPLTGGLLLALILIGLGLGWPLMPASVAAEDEDSFDAMSRAYAYVHQRPWHYAFYTLLSLGVGVVGLLAVELFAGLVVYLTAWGLGFGAPADTPLSYYGPGGAAGESPAATAHAFWLGLVVWLIRAWPYSYFWTAAATIYLLLRLEVDGTPWSRVAYQPPPGLPVPAAAPAKPAAVDAV